MLYLDIITIVCIGLLIGAEFAVSVFVNPILERFDTAARVKAISLFAKRLGTAMPFWYVLSFLLLVTEVVLRRHDDGVSLLIIAAAIWLVVIIATLIFLVPINNRMMQLDAGSLTDKSFREHRRWDLLHRARVLTLATSMICFLPAILCRR